MTLVFGTLCFEMGFLLLLVLPLPHFFRFHIVDLVILLENSHYFKIGVGFWVALMSLQVADCVSRLNRFAKSVGHNPYFTTTQNNGGSAPLTHEQLASKFYAQRNLYISGAVLYLLVSIFTVVSIVKKLVIKEKAIREVTANEKSGLKSGSSSADEDIKALIQNKNSEISTLKQRVKELQSQFDLGSESTNLVDKKIL